jgi:hypothetical protein
VIIVNGIFASDVGLRDEQVEARLADLQAVAIRSILSVSTRTHAVHVLTEIAAVFC